MSSMSDLFCSFLLCTCLSVCKCCSCCCRFHWLCWMSSSIEGAAGGGMGGGAIIVIGGGISTTSLGPGLYKSAKTAPGNIQRIWKVCRCVKSPWFWGQKCRWCVMQVANTEDVFHKLYTVQSRYCGVCLDKTSLVKVSTRGQIRCNTVVTYSKQMSSRNKAEEWTKFKRHASINTTITVIPNSWQLKSINKKSSIRSTKIGKHSTEMRWSYVSTFPQNGNVLKQIKLYYVGQNAWPTNWAANKNYCIIINKIIRVYNSN